MEAYRLEWLVQHSIVVAHPHLVELQLRPTVAHEGALLVVTEDWAPVRDREFRPFRLVQRERVNLWVVAH
jgi:hypothetical protein